MRRHWMRLRIVTFAFYAFPCFQNVFTLSRPCYFVLNDLFSVEFQVFSKCAYYLSLWLLVSKVFYVVKTLCFYNDVIFTRISIILSMHRHCIKRNINDIYLSDLLFVIIMCAFLKDSVSSSPHLMTHFH